MRVPGWYRCPSCKRRLHVDHPSRGISLSCAACSVELEPLIQPLRSPRPSTPAARHVVEVDG